MLTCSTVTKMLYTVVMRHLCLTADRPEERLFLQEPYDPFTTEIELKDTSEAFMQQYFKSFREPPPEDGSQALMQDRSDTGWLVWGKTMELGRMTGPKEDAYCMDETSQEGVAIIKNVMTGPNFWQTVRIPVNGIADDRWPITGHKKILDLTHPLGTLTRSLLPHNSLAR